MAAAAAARAARAVSYTHLDVYKRQPQHIETRPVTVIGGGTLGRKIALMMADRGGLVRVVDKIPEVREAAKAYVAENLPALAATIDGGAVGTIELYDDMADAVPGAWLVVECIPEKLELKLSLIHI